MKIVCDNCATKYSIADEKVRGKVFKIRCKKCSHIIVVRGGDGAAAPADGGAGDGGFPGDEQPTMAAGHGPSAAAAAASADAVWHLVIDREQVGPLTADEVRAKFAAGEVDVETYAWREGFADWLRLGSIEDFRDLGAAAAPAHDDGATRRTDSADLFASSSDDSGGNDAGADLFGGAAPMAAAASAPAPAADAFSGGGGLFGAPQAEPAPARPARISSPGFAAQAAPAPAMGGAETASEPRMTGQRNENSVLFSLNNLQALASGSGPGGAPKPAAEAPRPGFASSQTEGSGLIDIRAMAASTLAASPSPSSSSSEDGPAFAAAPIFSPMAAPILMPAAPTGMPKWMWAVFGVGGAAVIGIVFVGIVLLTRKPQVVQSPTPTQVATAQPGATPAAAGTPGAAVPAAHPAAAAPAAPAAPTETKSSEPARAEEHSSGKHHDKGGHHEHASSHAAAPAPMAAPAPAAAPKKHHGGDALDQLLDQASPDSPSASRPARHQSSSSDSNLPDQLDKGQIVSGMHRISGRVSGCYAQYRVPGLAMVSVTIGRSGRVSSAHTSGSFAGTPTGSCVERAVRGATFPPFKGSPQTIQYPFMLR